MVGRILLAICLVGLAVSVVVLFIAGVHQNDQISSLKSNGVHVEETVTGCMGQVAGSGSNIVGYQCRGTISLNGKTYNDPVPGSVSRDTGSKVLVVADSTDPTLVASVSQVATENASSSVYVVPSVLLAVFLIGVGVVTIGWRRRRKDSLTAENSAGNKGNSGTGLNPIGSDGTLMVRRPAFESSVRS